MRFLIVTLRGLAFPWRWYLRAAILWMALSFIAPVAHRAPMQAQQTVETLHPEVCVHTDLKDEVDEWKIQRSLELVREMGAPTIVEFFPWAYIESQRGIYNWYQADRIVRHARNQGVRIIARMGLVPSWARPDDTTLNYLPEDSFDDFARFVADFAARYADTIDHVIIWNEPNLAFEWGYQEVDPGRYVRLLQAVYEPLHRANPDIIVLAGALAPTLEPPGSVHGLNDLLYLTGLYQAGAAHYFDALAVHAYGLTEPHDAEPGFDRLNFRRVELTRAIMELFGDEVTPVYVTESGWNDDTRWTKAVHPSQRIAYTIGAFEWAAANWPWMEALCIWNLRYPRPTGRYPDNFTLITPEFQIKPIYYAIQTYARGWATGGEPLWLPVPGD